MFLFLLFIAGCNSRNDEDDIFNLKETEKEKTQRLLTVLHDMSKDGDMVDLKIYLSDAPLDPSNKHPYYFTLCESQKLFHKDKTIINKLDSDGLSPLHYAAIKGHEDIAGLLLNNGANIDIMDGYVEHFRHGSAIHIAALEGRNKVINVFLKYNADVNSTYSDYGQTPLHFAVRGGHLDTVMLLIENGAIINCVDGDGNPPIKYARKNTIYEYLKKNGALDREELLQKLIKEYEEQELKDKNPNNPASGNGLTAAPEL
jgi:hypothetical protein